MSKIPEFRAWYDNKMWCLAKLDLWGDPDQATCDLAPYMPKYEELYDIYLSDVILMQSTGLKGKDGVEIYEGDIVRYFRNELAVIVYRNGGVDIRSLSWGDCEPLQRRLGEIEVIGNIYENPEVLAAEE